jgi:hypothetical protein
MENGSRQKERETGKPAPFSVGSAAPFEKRRPMKNNSLAVFFAGFVESLFGAAHGFETKANFPSDGFMESARRR